MTLKAVADQVIVKQPVFETKLASGIELPDQGLHHDRGYVVACGDDAGVKVGDFVLFPPFGGRFTEFEGQKLQVIKASDILGVFEPD